MTNIPPAPPEQNLSNPFTSIAAIGLVTQIAAMLAGKYLPENMRNNAVDLALQVWQWGIGPGMILFGHWWQNHTATKLLVAARSDAAVFKSSGPFRRNNILPSIAILLTCMLGMAVMASQTGCNLLFPATQPTSTATVTVSLQQTITASVDVINAFLVIDDDNREYMKANQPAIHQLAENLRKLVPPVVQAAETALSLYESVSTPDNEAAVDTQLNQLQMLASLVRGSLSQPNVAALKPANK